VGSVVRIGRIIPCLSLFRGGQGLERGFFELL